MPGNGAVEHRQGGLRRALSAPQGSASRSIAAPARKPQQALYYYDIPTPLREFVLSQPTIIRHCEELHAAVQG